MNIKASAVIDGSIGIGLRALREAWREAEAPGSGCSNAEKSALAEAWLEEIQGAYRTIKKAVAASGPVWVHLSAGEVGESAEAVYIEAAVGLRGRHLLCDRQRPDGTDVRSAVDLHRLVSVTPCPVA